MAHEWWAVKISSNDIRQLIRIARDNWHGRPLSYVNLLDKDAYDRLQAEKLVEPSHGYYFTTKDGEQLAMRLVEIFKEEGQDVKDITS